MIASRSIDDLLPQVKKKALLFIEGAKEAKIDLLVTCTYRDFEEQTHLYAQGRTVAGDIVTNATAGKSWHNWKRAFDVVPLVHGKCVWNDTLLWHRIGMIGRKLGLEWAGDWRKFKEYPHFQFTEGLVLAALLEQHPNGLEEAK